MAKKKKLNILIIVLIVIAVVVVGRNIFIKFTIEQAVGIATGLPLKIGSFHVGLFKPEIIIKDFQLQNPKGYQDRVMLDVPEIYVHYVPGSFLKGKVHLKEIRFHMREFLVVKNEDGTSNLDTLKAIQKPKEGAKKGEKKDSKEKKSKLVVDNLSLKVDKVVFKDYKNPDNPKVKEYNINLDEQHEDIKSLNAVIGVIVVKTLAKTTIASLTNFDLGSVSSMFSGSLGSTTEAAGKMVGDTKETTKKILIDTTKSIKGLFKFGDK